MTRTPPIRPREREAILQALRAGVVPRIGIRHILVNRDRETTAIVGDLETLKDGGSAFRLIIGDYGSGKSFFLGIARMVALERNFVTMTADLSPTRRLNATGGQARALYQALAASTATRAMPDGGALFGIVEKFVENAREKAKADGAAVEDVIRTQLGAIREMPLGYDFADVITAYARGQLHGEPTLAEDAVRWLRGEFTTRTDSRSAIQVRRIIDDANIYDVLKLLGRFVRLAGYSGLLVTLDEMVNLYKLANGQARSANYEQILRILNDSLQGQSVGLGILMGGTPDFLMDPRRGLYSYPALESRLSANEFAREGLVDTLGPVIRLGALTQEDLYVLLGKLHAVYVAGQERGTIIPEEGYQAFMEHCSRRLGDAYFRTPRQTIRSFVDLMGIIDQNPGEDWRVLLGQAEVAEDREPELADVVDGDPAADAGDGLASFRIGTPPTGAG